MRRAATLSRFFWSQAAKDVSFGKYCRGRLLVFLLPSLCQGEHGSAKKDMYAARLGHAVMVRHFLEMVVGQRLAQWCRNGMQAARKDAGDDIGLKGDP